jgi:phosphoserine aminotransferase
MASRIFNFNAGPGVLPEPVLEEAQRDLMALPGVGMSVLEISHRSKPFDEILQGCESDMRRLAGIPDNYRILFLQGGATLQFSMVPMNFLPPGGKADYVVTGAWGQKAAKEAQRLGGNVAVLAPAEKENFDRVPEREGAPARSGRRLRPLHLERNDPRGRVAEGAERGRRASRLRRFLRHLQPADRRLALRPDLCRAQKNLGPSGVTLVLVRDDLLARSPKALPTLLDYNTHVKEHSLYNTPPVFGVYVIRLTMKWLLAEGGLEAMGRRNAAKGEGALRRARRVRRLLQAPRPAREPLEHERDVPPPLGGSRKAFRLGTKKAGSKGSPATARSAESARRSTTRSREAGVTALVSFLEDFRRRNG